MSSMTDKAKGYANQAAGAAKKGAGEATGNDRLQAEGATQKVTGQAQVGVGKAKDAVKNVVDKA